MLRRDGFLPNTNSLGNVELVEKTLDVVGDVEERAVLLDISRECRSGVTTSVESYDMVVFLQTLGLSVR